MNSGSWRVLAGLLLTLAMFGPLQAKGDILWNWSYVNAETKVSASGTLSTKELSDGAYSITTITGLWNGAKIASLEPIRSCCSPPGWNSNLLIDGETKLDKGGFAFSASGNLQVNLFYKDGGYAYEIRNGPEVKGGVFAATRRSAD